MSIKRIIFLLIAIAVSFAVALGFWNLRTDVAVSPGPGYEDLNLDRTEKDSNPAADEYQGVNFKDRPDEGIADTEITDGARASDGSSYIENADRAEEAPLQ